MRNRRFPVGLSTKFLADRTCTKSEMTATHVLAERTNAKAIVITAKALAGGAYTRAVVITTYLTADDAHTIVVVLSAKTYNRSSQNPNVEKRVSLAQFIG
jgi:hypothetical protein